VPTRGQVFGVNEIKGLTVGIHDLVTICRPVQTC
jgi:hypothetical protein